MYKIILADDEPLILKGLKKMINLEKLNAKVVGQAENGEQLSKLIQELEPDIVISDIEMPKKTGLDVIKEVKERNLNIKIIFLTGFQEFNYAKSAITYGAVDYLLKPVRKEELERTILQAEKMLQKDTISTDLFEVEEDGIQSIFNNMNSNYGADDYYKQFREIGIEMEAKEFIGVCFSISKEAVEAYGESSKFQLLEFAIFKKIQDYLKKEKVGFVLKRAEKRSNVIFILHSDRDDKYLEMHLNKIVFMVMDEYKMSLDIGIGEIVNHISQLQYTYKTAKFASELHYFQNEKMIKYENIEREFHHSFEEYNAGYKKFIQSIVNKEEAWHYKFQDCLSIIENLHYGNRFAAENRCIVLAMDFLRELTECNLIDCSANNIQKDYEKAIEALRNQYTYQDLRKVFTKFMTEFVDNMYETNNGVDKSVIREVKEYIQVNFAEDISLNQIAKKIYMNPYYLSTYFKKETGQNFKDYVAEVRMKEALKILGDKDIKTYQLAQAVGYKDVRTFTEKFKKKYGNSPTEYKKK